MNHVSLVGRLVQSPSLKTLQDGNCVTRFNVAVDRYFSSAQKEEKKSEGKATADFPRIVVWGRQAENCCKFLEKGSMISISGRVNTSIYEGNGGEHVYSTEIVGDRIRFLDAPKRHEAPDAIQ